MSFKNSDLRVVDINFENNARNESRNSSRNSIGDELMSRYSYTDSDLHDFHNMERDIYGSQGDDESSEEHDIMKDIIEDGTDEQTESLEFVRPHVPVRPSLGDPIDTYDQLQINFKPLKETISESDSNQDRLIKKNIGTNNSKPPAASPSYNTRASSRASGGSIETVLSHNQEIDEMPPVLQNKTNSHKPHYTHSSISSNDSVEKPSKKHLTNRATLKTLLDQEKAARQSQETYIDHLQQSINQLLSQNALAKETIDQLRLGVTLNINEVDKRPKLRRFQKRNSGTSNSQTLPRRYSSFIGSSYLPDYVNESNISRAKSVDMFDEESRNEVEDMHSSNKEFGGSLKLVKNNLHTNQGLSRDIVNDFQLNFDKFQTRVEIIEQAIEELSIYIDGGASGSSGSQYGDLEGSNDRHQSDIENRLNIILTAYDTLQKDFNQVCQVWKDTAKNYMPAAKAMHNMDSAEQIEGSLFQLRMQLDDVERHVKHGRQPPNIHQTSSENITPNGNLVKRLADLEEKYNLLINRYHNLKRFTSPSRQKEMEDVVQQLSNIVNEANGRSSKIATPEIFENMLHQDVIDSMKFQLSSDSPPYILTEEDGLSSANSSFGKGRSRRKKQKVDGNQNWMSHEVDRFSPIKSRVSPHSVDLKTKYSPSNQFPTYDSQPVSLVSSNSGWQGATSGETLLVDERGILKESYRQSSKSTNDMFLPSSSKVEARKSRSYANSVDLESLRSRPNSSGLQNLDEDVKRLDEHLARIELEDKSREPENINRDSDINTSRNTRSLLGTSPSNSNFSRQSKPSSSVGSSARSGKNKQTKKEHDNVEKIRKRYSFKRPVESTDSGEESGSYEEDLNDYVRTAGCGIGARSRFVRKKNNNVQDRWSQTPKQNIRKSVRSAAYDRNLSSEYDDPYIDNVAYWDGIAFHPARECLPGKSILRRSSPRSQYSRNRIHDASHPRRPYSDSFSNYPFYPPSQTQYYEPASLREYSSMGPHRYFVREYGHLNRLFPNQYPMYENYEDDEDDEHSYRKYVEERRLCNYLDEAIKAARDMKQYTRRLNDICEERQSRSGSHHGKYFRPVYT